MKVMEGGPELDEVEEGDKEETANSALKRSRIGACVKIRSPPDDVNEGCRSTKEAVSSVRREAANSTYRLEKRGKYREAHRRPGSVM